MARKIDVILSAIDKFTPVMDDATDSTKTLGDELDNTGDKAGNTGKKFDISFQKVTAGLAIAGAAMTAFAQSQQELRSETGRAATSLGMEKDAFIDLANEVSNVTFPLDEAVSLLEAAGKAGLQSESELAEFATFWDTLGDASGENSLQLANGAAGLRAMGIAAGEESAAMGAYGTILQNTSIDITKFNELASRNAEVAKANGLSIDDLAVAYSYMQNELGMTAEMMESQFETVIQSNMSAIEDYGKSLGDSSTHVQDLADAHADSFSLWDKITHSVEELTFKYQDQIAIAGNFGTIMTGVSSALSIASAAQAFFATTTGVAGATAGAAAAPIGLFGIALNTAIWPIVLIVAAIAAVIAIIVLVVKHFKTLKEKFTNSSEGMKKVALLIFGPMFMPLIIGFKLVQAAIEFFKKHWDKIWSGIAKAFKVFIDLMLLPFKLFINFIIDGVNLIIKVMNKLGANIKAIDKLDVSIGDVSVNRSNTQTVNVNATTEIDGKAVAKSTSQAVTRTSSSNSL